MLFGNLQANSSESLFNDYFFTTRKREFFVWILAWFKEKNDRC